MIKTFIVRYETKRFIVHESIMDDIQKTPGMFSAITIKSNNSNIVFELDYNKDMTVCFLDCRSSCIQTGPSTFLHLFDDFLETYKEFLEEF